MNLGQQLLAPIGFANLRADERYYFLKNDTFLGRVTLAVFTTQSKGRRIRIVRIDEESFQKGIAKSLIVTAKEQRMLPVWLGRVEHENLHLTDLKRTGVANTNASRAERRFGYIAGLLPRLNEIVLAENPFKIINEHARNTTPRQNRTRLAEWFFAYVCHSFQLAALWPEYPNVGTYDKTDEKFNETHFGRRTLEKGARHGWPSALFAAEIVEAVDGLLGKVGSKHEIYIQCLKNVWGCRARMDERGKWEMFQPDGKPYPDTEGKFWYRWYQHLDLYSTNISIYGAHHMRSKAGTKGSYSQNVSSLLSKMEVDAYYLKERPRLVFGDANSLRLCVARGVCVGSKNVVGVGFSLEGESAYAYQMMLFCAAIGIDEFARLWGLEKRDFLDVYAKGLPPHLIADRGKAPIAAIVSALMKQFPVKELTETYSGQSKPSVESGHPRDANTEGPPEYLVSDKDIIQLIKREICRAAKDNHVRNVDALIIGDRVSSETVYSPYALARYLDERGLNDTIQITFDTAVRNFLPETDITLRDGGFWVHSRCYSNDELDAGNTYAMLSAGQEVSIKGYFLPLNLMYVWVEFEGRLHKLKQKLAVRIGEREQMLTIGELEAELELKRTLAAEQRRSAVAAETEAQVRFEAHSGVSWGDTSRKPGRPRKTHEAVTEKKVLMPKRPGKKAA